MSDRRSQLHSSSHPSPTHAEDSEELKKSLARGTPWLSISIAAHAIVIALISLHYVRKSAPAVDLVIAPKIAHTEEVSEPLPPEIETPRSAVPEAPQQDDENERQIDVPVPPSVEQDAGDPNLTGVTTDPNVSISTGTDVGYDGSTNIGVGLLGHRGSQTSSYAGKDGKGGRKGRGGLRQPATAGGSRVQTNITDGLDWLKRHQNVDGSWSCEGFESHCVDAKCSGPGDPAHSIGVTGLALLAFLGSENTTNRGRYQNVVKSAVRYLLAQQDEKTGSFGPNNGSQGWIYDQMIASLAVCEAYGLSNILELKKGAQRAVAFVQSARNPYKSWRYAVPGTGENDTSVTGWGMMVLRSAKDFGLEVDGQAFEGVRTWLDEMTDPSTGRCGYILRGGFSAREQGALDKWPAQKVEAMTAVSMLCRAFLGQDPKTTPELRNGADLLRKSLPLWDEAQGTIDYYYWYYGSYAMYQMGGDDWAKWESKMLDSIVKKQAPSGCEKGSWDPQFDPWGARGGRVYATAINTLTCEVYFRYARVIGSR